jgi:hypothetical protein
VAQQAQQAETVNAMAKAEAGEVERQEAARKAAATKVQADLEAEDWTDLEPDMVQNIPYKIRAAHEYSSEALNEIETLYYSLRMVRNGMRRATSPSQGNSAS